MSAIRLAPSDIDQINGGTAGACRYRCALSQSYAPSTWDRVINSKRRSAPHHQRTGSSSPRWNFRYGQGYNAPGQFHIHTPGSPQPGFSFTGEASVQGYLLIGGNQDSLNYPAHADAETIYLPVSVTGREAYTRSTLTLGDVSITVYLHESLTPEQALNRVVEHYKAWAANQPGGRLWGIMGRSCASHHGAIRDMPHARSGRNALHSAPSVRRGNCTHIQHCEEGQQAEWDDWCNMTAVHSACPIFAVGFSLGNLGTRLRSEHWGIQGQCPHPSRQSALRSTPSFRRRSCISLARNNRESQFFHL